MWSGYLLIALRVLARNRVYAAINVGGLALGLAGCLLILSYVRYEQGYDRWLPDSGRIYQVQTILHPPGKPVTQSQNSPMPVREMLPIGFPQIEALSVVSTGPTVTQRNGEATLIDAAIVDPAFFTIFKLPFAAGTGTDPLPDMNSVVLTQAEALKQFGTTDVVGRSIPLGAGPGRRDYRVTGVLRDLPRNSNLKFGIVFRYDSHDADGVPLATRWGRIDRQHYVKLRAGADPAAINTGLSAWERRVIPRGAADAAPSARADAMDLRLVPIGAVHLGEAQDGAMVPVGDRAMLATFAVVALLTLGMAVMNFVNLSTARATLRAREVALRKTVGATRRQLIVQFLSEALVTAGIAMLLALSIAELAVPWIGARLGGDLKISYFGEGGLIAPAIGLFLVTGLLGGLYPAFYLSRFQPAQVLHANLSTPDVPGGGRLRTGLVMLQFAAAIGLLASTYVIYVQTRYVQTVDPGYRRDGLIELDSAWRFAGDGSEFAAARREMLAIPGVVGVGRTNLGLAATNRTNPAIRVAGGAPDLAIGFYRVDADFLRTLDAPLLAGRHFDERHGNDRILHAPDDADAAGRAAAARMLAARGINIIANRGAIARLGFARPDAAIGRTIAIDMDGAGFVPSTIVGVVEDMRVRTARDALEPIIYGYDPDGTSQVVVRYAAARPGAVMAGLNKVWRRFEPEIPFQGRFAEEIVAEVYAADRARGALFAAFAGLAVVIACLGLYGLAAFAAERRKKEIGIRKVLGARARDIVRLLAWQFCRPVLLANLIAWPIAWWAMRDWLDRFDVRVALGPAPFVAAGGLALVISLLTIGSHAFRMARTNPIHALRYE